MENLKVKFDKINELLVDNKESEAFKKLNQLSEKEKENFRYTALLCRYLFKIKDYNQVEEILSKNTFDNFRYQSLWCKYYYVTDNPKQMELSVNKLLLLTPPEELRLRTLENLNFLKSDYILASEYVDKIIKMNPKDNFKDYSRLFNYLFLAEDFEGYKERLENILKENTKFFFFSPLQFFDTLVELYNEEKLFKYIINLISLYPNHHKLEQVSKKIITQLNLQTIKETLTLEEKKIISNSNINENLKSRLLDLSVKDNLRIEDIENNLNNQEYKKIIYQLIDRNKHTEALEIAKKMSNSKEMIFFINQTPKDNDLKRDIIKKENIHKSSVIISPPSNHSQGTILVFGGLAMKAMLPFEIIDRFFAAMNLNAIYIVDLHKTLYLDGIANYANSIDSAVEYLKKTTEETTNLYVLGTSAGGMAACIYGDRLNAKSVLCFSPPSTLTSKFDTRGKLIIKRMKNQFDEKKLNVQYYFKNNISKVKIETFYGEEHIFDVQQIEGYRDIDNIKINKIPNCDRHDTLNYLAEKKNIIELFSEKLGLE